jgi:uncharacterized protein (DUF1778 family)
MRLTEEISDETHTKTLNTRLKDARDLLEQAAAYPNFRNSVPEKNFSTAMALIRQH